MGLGRVAHFDYASLAVIHAARRVMQTDGGRLGPQMVSFGRILLA